jgi:hypothetical protein
MSILSGQSALNTFYELHIETEDNENLEIGLDSILESVGHMIETFLTHFNCLKFTVVCEAQMQVFISQNIKNVMFRL